MADVVEDALKDAMSNTDAEILDNAFADTPPKEVEAVEPKVEKPEPARDEAGKFTAKPDKPEAGKTAPPVVAKSEPEPDDQGNIPSWRLREVAEERRLAKAEAETERQSRIRLEGEMAEIRRQLAAQQKPAEQPKQEDIDPLLDPQGYSKRMRDEFQASLREERLNNNLAIAHVKHGEKFEKAYAALIEQGKAGNRQIVNQITNQPNPGEALVKWFADQETLREVGSDPAAYKQKMLDDALKDPTFLARAVEAFKSSAGATRPNNVTQLPPSLSRVTGSSAEPSDTELQGVDALLAR